MVVATVGFAVANPPQHDGFTEFSIETEDVDGDMETMYESTYGDGDQELGVTITNREHADRTYTTVVLLERVSYEGDGEQEQEQEQDPEQADSAVIVHERDELDRQTVTIADGETGEQILDVTPTIEGDDLRLTILLYDDEPPSEPTAENAYRIISLPMEGPQS